MRIFILILLLQMIDARNFAKAKRNIFKIQLKREPRRKREKVSSKTTASSIQGVERKSMP